jgi:hypothetical protein
MGNQSRHPAIATVKRVQPQEAMVNRRYCDQAARRRQPARVVAAGAREERSMDLGPLRVASVP